MKIFILLSFFFLTFVNANEKVVLQLKWLHQFQFAGYYAALEKGFYEEEGLDVEIRERNVAVNNIDQVLNNEAQYGVADSVLFLYAAKGSQLKIVAPIFQHSPNVLITLKNSGLDSPYKLQGKRLVFYKKDTDGFGILGMLRSLQIKPQIDRVRTGEDHKLLLSGDADAYASYLTNEPFEFKQKGVELNIINPANYGFDLYGDILFTNATEAAEHPKRVEAFKRATLKGWQYALKNKEEIIALIKKKYNPDKSLEHLRFEAEGIAQVIQNDLIPLGTLDRGRIEYMMQLYTRYELLDSQVNINEYIFEAYADSNIDLTLDEKYFLANKGEITMCIDPDWMPFEKLEGGKHIGMSADYFKILQQKLETPIRVIPTTTWAESLEAGKQRKCDIFSLVMPTQERLEYLDFTKSYIRVPLVVVTGLDELFIDDISKLKGKKVGVIKGYAYTEILRKKYPYLDLIEFENLTKMLEGVKNNKVDAAIEALVTTGYHIQKEYIGELKIAGKLEDMWELGIGTRNDEPMLLSIFNKALSQVSSEQHQEILNKWISVNYTKELDLATLISWIAAITLIFATVLSFIYRTNRRLSKEIQTRIQTQRELQNLINLYETLSITDELTQLYNRRHFNELFLQEINRAKRDCRQIAFLMLDVDFFKNYNDTYGHLKGDETLKAIADVLKRYTKRAGDFAFRLGGEEFGLIISTSSYEEARKLAEAIRQSVADLAIEHKASAISDVVTVSIGLSFYKCPLQLDVDTFYKEVDDNLYAAKEQGRNRVVASYNEPAQVS
jgi:diguanylate cyclase (GGDEF)-like protein